MFSTGRLSSEVPYPFIYHFSRKRYPFRAESPRINFCKKTDFLHKNAAFLQKYILCKKAVFLQPVNLWKSSFFTKIYFFVYSRWLWIFLSLKSPEEWAITKQVCRDGSVVFFLFPIFIYIYTHIYKYICFLSSKFIYLFIYFLRTLG